MQAVENNSFTKTWLDGPAVTTTLFDHIVIERRIANYEAYIAPKFPDDLHDGKLLPDCEVATRRIWQAIEQGQTIGIVGDYDMDGTPAAVLLAQFLERCGATFEVILPTRSDGYGFSPYFVERLAAKGASLIITVDCGIRDHAAVERAHELGCDVIITDHHECGESLPPALAVVNPKRPDSAYPFPELCGTGVAYKITEALIHTAPATHKAKFPAGYLPWSLDLVALATIGDMVPLVDENRVLVYYGLKVLRTTKRIGLRRLAEALDLRLETITASDVAFRLIPKCNASGRMESMDDIYTILLSHQTSEVDAAIKRVLARSTQSQLLLNQMLEQAKEKLAQTTPGSVIILSDDRWHPGLTGIVAARLVEEYKRPVGVLASLDGQTFRGSMRSIPGVHLPTMLSGVTNLLAKYGGHEQAAGLSVEKANVQLLSEVLASLDLAHLQSSHTPLTTDGVITADAIKLMDIEKLQALSPWGMGNPEPLWSLCRCQLRDIKWLSDGRHVRAIIPGSEGGLPLIYFGAETARSIIDSPIDLYGTLSINEFRGKRDPQFMVRGICLAQL